MDYAALGAIIRTLRLRRGWRQADLAAREGTSRWTVARVERGGSENVALTTIGAMAASLDARLTVRVVWRGGELDRVLNARHASFHEIIAARFAALPDWIAVPEVTFSVYGERGAVDVLAWHAATATVLVVELKTEIVDLQDLMGTLDRKRRLAREIAASRGWSARTIAAWLVVAEGRTNRRRVAAHRAVLGAAFPDPAARVDRWLHQPEGPPLAALSFVTDEHGTRTRSGIATPMRVARRRPRTNGMPPAA